MRKKTLFVGGKNAGNVMKWIFCEEKSKKAKFSTCFSI